MVIVTTEILIDIPVEACFDLARDMTVHTQTVWKHTKEKAVRGTVAGRIGEGEVVTFEATHFFIRQKLTSKVVDYKRPFYFVDVMVQGAFKSMRHEHAFEDVDGKTLMRDRLIFEAPLGFLGWIAERIVLKTYMTRFLKHRNRQLKMIAENQGKGAERDVQI
ncbi:SRPBCC family protein [Paenibacillus chibensis]|uniref:SRPBCC family protein n=1 Tax=Paenibacillus chibensis TaxID=59846 RepID=A0ABU6PR41_9BACL|nr:SRPBCC family protein [Paenibacillus chibensis]